jgi:hypothetical protein
MPIGNKAGSRPKKGVTSKWEDKAWKYPKPTTGKR